MSFLGFGMFRCWVVAPVANSFGFSLWGSNNKQIELVEACNYSNLNHVSPVRRFCVNEKLSLNVSGLQFSLGQVVIKSCDAWHWSTNFGKINSICCHFDII